MQWHSELTLSGRAGTVPTSTCDYDTRRLGPLQRRVRLGLDGSGVYTAEHATPKFIGKSGGHALIWLDDFAVDFPCFAVLRMLPMVL